MIDLTINNQSVIPLSVEDNTTIFQHTEGYIYAISPSAKVEESEDGATITITDKDGETVAMLHNGLDGKDGLDGKTAYQYAVDGGYTGTEADFAVKLATDGVLSVNDKTGTVTITAEDLGAMTGMTILSYGHSTWSDFIEAHNANRLVYCKASSSSNPASGEQRRMAFLAYFETNLAEFQYYRSVSSHTDAQQGDQVMVYQLRSNNTWSVTTRSASSRVVAGTGLSSNYTKDKLTLLLDPDYKNKIDTLWEDYQSRTS